MFNNARILFIEYGIARCSYYALLQMMFLLRRNPIRKPVTLSPSCKSLCEIKQGIAINKANLYKTTQWQRDIKGYES